MGEQNIESEPAPRRAELRRRGWWGAGGVTVLAIVVFGACTLSPRAPTAAPGKVISAPDVSATVAVAVQATVQARAQTAARAGTPAPSIVLDEKFAATPNGWPDHPDSTAWYADTYQLEPREVGQFVAIDAPPTDAFHDGIVSARFHKAGGPPGGGYGVIVDDQGPEVHDGLYQGGRFVVLEVGDDGTVGAWQRADDHWIDVMPWTPSSAVHQSDAPNILAVRCEGRQLTFFVNDTQVAQFTTDLPAGRIGVFVGGDGNQVALERFTAQWPSQAGAVAAPVRTTPTPLSPAKPTTAPTPAAAELLAELDAAWAQSRWSDVKTLLDRIEPLAPTALDYVDKRYAAHMAAGQDLLAKGNKASATDEFTKAVNVDPDRGEAHAALVALTPTPTPAPSLPSANKPLTQFVGAVLDDIDAFWSKYLDSRGEKYLPATRHWYSERTVTRCGPAVPGQQGAFYCTVDSGLYLDQRFVQGIRQQAGEFPVAYAVAHEVGHHVQDLFGVTKMNAYIVFGQYFSREIELQADCFAGVWSKSASQRNMAAPEDITQALTLAWKLGDPAWSSQRSIDAHGTPDDRTAAFLKGFNGNVPAACGLK